MKQETLEEVKDLTDEQKNYITKIINYYKN
jgi:hypothetical protein